MWNGLPTTQLSKAVCRSCIGDCWSEVDEANWKTGIVACPIEKRYEEPVEVPGITPRTIKAGARRKELIHRGEPASCPFRLEHVLATEGSEK